MPGSPGLVDRQQAILHSGLSECGPGLKVALTLNTGAFAVLFIQWAQGTKLCLGRNPVIAVIGISPTTCS